MYATLILLDENGDDDYEFNPLLLCPDISMDVDESSVLTETTGNLNYSV